MKARLLARGTENQEEINSRLLKVAEESTFERKFDVSILNHDLNMALENAEGAVNHFLDNTT